MGEFTYAQVGATDEGRVPPAGYRHLRYRAMVGSGSRDFAAAGAALLDWRMHRALGIVRLDADADEAAPGVLVTVHLGAGPLRVHAPCRVVWAARGPRRAGWAYGTLPGHPERGEESFVGELDDAGTVWLTVTAFSRPARWFTRLAGPLVPPFQRLYARRCAQVLRRITVARTRAAESD